MQVIYTRTQDVSLNVENIPGQHKRYDLKNRLKIAQKYPQAIFVSIHMNKFAQPQYGGAQVFYSVNHPDSETLAAQMRQDICDTLQPENQRTIKAAGSSIYLLDRCKSPAVLVECGFLSNPDDTAMLCSTAGQTKMAAVLSQSILAYFSNKEPAA